MNLIDGESLSKETINDLCSCTNLFVVKCEIWDVEAD
jgi:hypothetical protein